MIEHTYAPRVVDFVLFTRTPVYAAELVFGPAEGDPWAHARGVKSWGVLLHALATLRPRTEVQA